MNKPIRKILIYPPNWLGDAAMCTAALRVIHKRFPDAEIGIAGRGSVCDLLDGFQWLSEIITIPARPGFFETLRTGRMLRRFGADLAVVFPHSFRSALLARLAGSRDRLGYDRQGRSFLLSHIVEPHKEDGCIVPIYMAKEYLDLVADLGCADDDEGLELHANSDVVDAIRTHLVSIGVMDASSGQKLKPLIGIAPGAAFGPSKMWPVDRFIAVVNGLMQKTDSVFLLLTGPGEEEVRDKVLANTEACICLPEIEASGIEQLKAAISQLDLLISNDSGPRHIAVAFDVPIICIMGPTSPRYTEGPYEKGEVIRVDVDCGPCQKPICETDHRCMTRITPETVIKSALGILGIGKT